MMTENDSNPAPSGAPVTTLPLRRFAMPALTLDMATLRYNENKVLTAELMRPDADIHVDIQDGFLFCRGEREALIRSGILKDEWFPGVPGNGRYAHAVLVDDRSAAGPTTQIRLYIRVWSHAPLIFEVRMPMSPHIGRDIDDWLAHPERSTGAGTPATAPTAAPDNTRKGTIVYLRPQAPSRDEPGGQ